MSAELLRIDNLSIDFVLSNAVFHAVRETTFSVNRGQTVAVVGESGSGKSTLAFSIMRYLPSNAVVNDGHIYFDGTDLLGLTTKEMRSIWGRRISMVYQDADSALNPSLSIGQQIVEAIMLHGASHKRRAWVSAIDLLTQVSIVDADVIMNKYPHQLSGGQKQRVLIALALSSNPDLLIMDEPTTALDVTTESKILDLVEELKQKIDAAILYVTHDLGVVSRIADQVVVLYAGEVVETGDVRSVFDNPAHPYTSGLMHCIPSSTETGRSKLPDIPGRLPSLRNYPTGCIFADRCQFVRAECRANVTHLRAIEGKHYTSCLRISELENLKPRYDRNDSVATDTSDASFQKQPAVLSIHDAVKHYGQGGLWIRPVKRTRNAVRAVDGVSLEVRAGETVGLVGESGSGKTTIAESIVKLVNLTRGDILFDGRPIADLSAKDRDYRRRVRIVFQNPDSSLNPKKRIREILERPLDLFRLARTRPQKDARLSDLLELVRLDRSYLSRYPGELSGGEKQRIAIARAFATNPDLVICDEPTSALDVSVQASILNLLVDLQQQFSTAYLFISHDLSVVRHISDELVVMYRGKVVEKGATETIFTDPAHPYTKTLLSAIPTIHAGTHNTFTADQVVRIT